VRERTLLWHRWAAGHRPASHPTALRSVPARSLHKRTSHRELPGPYPETELPPVSGAERILSPDRYQRAAIVQKAVALQTIEAPRV
jgi:hypothetical protein